MAEEGTQGTHLYAIRYPPEHAVETKRVAPSASSGSSQMQEQCPTAQNRRQKEAKKKISSDSSSSSEPVALSEPISKLEVPTEALPDFFQPTTIKRQLPKQTSKFCSDSQLAS
jgi:hypothetical protein